MFSKIIGTGSYLPDIIVKNKDFVKKIDTSEEWIFSRTGIKSRHFVKKDQKASDLALFASKLAILNAGIDKNKIDLIIVATTTPDMVFPSTACILQSKLGIRNCPAFDMQAVCSGFVYALKTADLFIKSGNAKNVLIVGAEVYSKILDWNDRTTSVLFGDGAGAVILTESKKPGILSAKIDSEGKNYKSLCVPGWLNNSKAEGNPFVKMDGQLVFKFAVKILEEISTDVLNIAKKTIQDIDWYIPHQANIRIMRGSARRMKLDEKKLISTVDHTANISAASIPVALDESIRNNKIKVGDNILLAGVGAGFTWGAVFLKL